MENTNEFRATIAIESCMESYGTAGLATARGDEALGMLQKALRAYGMGCELRKGPRGTVEIVIEHAEPWKAAEARTRRAGRPKKYARRDVDLAWLESHSVEEGREALGNVSESTYYRRLREMRKTAR